MTTRLLLTLLATTSSAYGQDTGQYEPLTEELEDVGLPNVEPMMQVAPSDHFLLTSDQNVDPDLNEILMRPGAIGAWAPAAFFDAPAPGNPPFPGPQVLDLVVPELGLAMTLGETHETSWYPGSRTWVGQGDSAEQELVITTFAGEVSGFLVTPNGSFDIYGLANGSLVLVPEEATDDEEDDSTDPPFQPPPADPFPWDGSNGPYAHVAVIDLAMVYGADALNAVGGVNPEARLQVGIINAVGTANQAFAGSGVRAALRLVSMSQVQWTHPANTCDARSELVRSDGNIDDVLQLREDLGADLVGAVLDQGRVTSGGSGCAGTESNPQAGVTDGNFGFVVSQNALNTSTRHEIGHLAGLCHGRDESCSVKTTVANNAFGHQVPDDQEITDPADVCAGFRTIMSKSSARTIGGTSFPTNRINRFSSPEVHWSTTCGDGTTRRLPTGTTTRGADMDWADAAERLRETLPEIAAYRAPGAFTLAAGAVIHTPTPGTTLAAGDTVAWDGVPGGTGQYWVDVYDPRTGTVFSSSLVSTTSSLVASVPPGVVGVRLWSEIRVGEWSWVEHRFANQGLIVHCADEDSSVPPPSEFALATCDDGSGAPVCTLTGGEVTCDLRRGGGGDGWMAAVSGFYDAPAYDHAFYGRASDGSSFCCLVNDVGGDIDSIVLDGTYYDDILTASWESSTLDAVDGQPLDVLIRGRGGDDILLGSTSEDPAYLETLHGFKGNDRLYGFAGDDILRGGMHDDSLSGGSGNDVLVAGRHGANSLFGDRGSDTLCTERPGDRLIAAWTPESSAVNFLYISSIGNGAVNPDTSAGGTPSLCGHTVHGSAWGGCTFHNQASAPAACAALGVAD
mgnify:CR=1 FL=1